MPKAFPAEFRRDLLSRPVSREGPDSCSPVNQELRQGWEVVGEERADWALGVGKLAGQ
jgi:hypothetical protein